ncbi:hypothetical protein Glo7428_4890 (plasmid) [Gloeocapsa sp. PCC 7428]|uniref:hypothetical protein n=1 Tax=Gloeocapsa sp. PCC 7428 TaxID=1173026 RepID=UPI0002A60BFF|nr:hypothetical protein [Gloeocapsa sp. PCC 7428]AFZ33313.1 hypothetical protein Glo7428_4890 [Gloeocapsa sp. PCC 7428]
MTLDDDFQLDLLVPWDLPVEQQLSEAERTKLETILFQILKALAQTDHHVGLVIIQDILEELSTLDISPAEISSTKTALLNWEVQDFDRHFGVSHVKTQEPAFCLVRGLLIALHRMLLLLNDRNNQFDPAEVEYQRYGYISYVHLLSRVFNLNWRNCDDG